MDGSFVPLPNACDSFTMTATVLGAANTSKANFYLQIVDDQGRETRFTNDFCSVQANNGAAVSCTASLPRAYFALFGATGVGFYVYAGPDFQDAHILTKATCQ